jgi:hypothetical protein
VDAYGNVATGYRGSAAWTVSGGGVTAPASYTFTAADNGTHTFYSSATSSGLYFFTVTDLSNPQLTGTFDVFSMVGL